MVSQVKIPQKDEGYLIRSVDYSEDHRILSFLTRQNGRLDAIALGAKKSIKRFGPALDFLNRLQLEFERNNKGGLHRLVQVELMNPHQAIRKDYQRTWVALEWFKLLSLTLKDEGPVPGLFEIFDQSLTALGQDSLALVDQAFRYHLLASLGYELELTQCVRCHGKQGKLATFVAREGGLLCGSCHVPKASELRSPFFLDRWWASARENDLTDPSALEQQRKVLEEALAYYLAIPPAQGRPKGRKLPGITLKDSG